MVTVYSALIFLSDQGYIHEIKEGKFSKGKMRTVKTAA